MMRIITYSLKPDADNSDEYHRTISAFAASWLAQTRPKVLDLVSGFRERSEYRQGRGEVDRSDAEYIFELLALGVLLREHGDDARRMPGWMERLMPRLVAVQNRQPRLEGMIKALRGWLGWITDQAHGGERSEELVGLIIAWLGANDETVKA